MQMQKRDDYCFELKNLWYDREYLLDHLENIDNDKWYEFNCGHIRWTVHEKFDPRKECKNFKISEFHKELFSLFNPRIMLDTMIYTSTPVGGTPPHQDRNRPCVLNFAVKGHFDDVSPQTFYETYDRDSYLHDMPYKKSDITNEFAPWLFKGDKIHGVKNDDDYDRTIITCCWKNNSYADIQKAWIDGSLINWEANEKNKRIKVIK